jgi:hypothetical protein
MGLQKLNSGIVGSTDSLNVSMTSLNKVPSENDLEATSGQNDQSS